MSCPQRLCHAGAHKSLTTLSHCPISTFSASFTTEMRYHGHALPLTPMNFRPVGCYPAFIRNKIPFLPILSAKSTRKSHRGGLSIIERPHPTAVSAGNRDRWVIVCVTAALSCLPGEQGFPVLPRCSRRHTQVHDIAISAWHFPAVLPRIWCEEF